MALNQQFNIHQIHNNNYGTSSNEDTENEHGDQL